MIYGVALYQGLLCQLCVFFVGMRQYIPCTIEHTMAMARGSSPLLGFLGNFF